MNGLAIIDIHEFRVRLPEALFPYQGKQTIQVQRANQLASSDPRWVAIGNLSGDFFHPAFDKRNPLNMPGPFYGAESDTCETGPMEAPSNVLMDRNGQEFVFRQPSNESELRDVISAALCECFCGYGADGDSHWTVSRIREWWKSRYDLLAEAGEVRGSQESVLLWRRLLSGEAEPYLRTYAFFVEEKRSPKDSDVLPDVS